MAKVADATVPQTAWCRVALTFVVDEMPVWQPLTREQFGALQVGDRLRERRGREWTVTGPPHTRNGLVHVVIRSGDLVRVEHERFRDSYMLVGKANSSAGLDQSRRSARRDPRTGSSATN